MALLLLAGAWDEYVMMFTDRVVRACLVGQLEVCLDDIGHVAQQGGGALLPVILDQAGQLVGASGFHGFANACRRQLAAHLIAPQRFEADRLEDMYTVHYPANRRLPVDGFENPARGGRGNDVVGDALHLHLGSSETGPLSPDL